MDNQSFPTWLKDQTSTEKQPILGSINNNDTLSNDYGTKLSNNNNTVVKSHSRSPSHGSNKSTSHRLNHDHDDTTLAESARKRVIVAMAFCLVFMVAGMIISGLSNSLALGADVLHYSTDFAFLLTTFLAIKFSCQPVYMRSAWYRPEILVTLGVVLTTWIVTGVMVFEAAIRIHRDDYKVKGGILLVGVCLSILVTSAMIIALHEPKNNKSTDENSEKDDEKWSKVDEGEDLDENDELLTTNKKIHDILHLAFFYLLCKVFLKVLLFVAGMLIWFHPNWILADTINTIITSLTSLAVTVFIIHRALQVILDATPFELDMHKVKDELRDLDGVGHVHHLKLWSSGMDMDETAGSVHLAVKQEKLQQNVMTEASRLLHERFGLEEVTIQMEVYSHGMEHNDCEL